MLFNSYEFLIFFLIVFILYWVSNRKLGAQNMILLISSYIFYGWWDWRFLILLFINSLGNYILANQIFKERNSLHKQRYLLAALVFNFAILGFFKYFNFFVGSFSNLAHSIGFPINTLTLNVILPVGISFYTFQALSYVIDVYRGTIKPTSNPINFFTFITLFPQLVAGPIERSSNLLKQIEVPRKFDREWFNAGIFQVAVGFFRKIVIADSLAVYVDKIYSQPELYGSNTLIVATIFYAFQIYYDFAGYSDIAIGSAKMLGFRFNQNFNLPYFSKSLTEFWRKWHMSLSYWLRDYLYISLGGNRKGIRITYRNLMITMLLGGLWHGSSWNFVIWGGIHGAVLSFEKYLKSKKFLPPKSKLVGDLGYVTTFAIVCFAWIFFRSQSWNDTKIIIGTIFNYQWSPINTGDINVFVNALFVLLLGIGVDLYLKIKKEALEEIAERWGLFKTAFWIAVLIVSIGLFYSSSKNFIYFQF